MSANLSALNLFHPESISLKQRPNTWDSMSFNWFMRVFWKCKAHWVNENHILCHLCMYKVPWNPWSLPLWSKKFKSTTGGEWVVKFQTSFLSQEETLALGGKTLEQRKELAVELVNIQQQEARPWQPLYKQRHLPNRQNNRQTDRQTNRQTDTTCEYSAGGGMAMTAPV